MSSRQTMSLGDTLLQLLFRFIVSTVYGAYLPRSYVIIIIIIIHKYHFFLIIHISCSYDTVQYPYHGLRQAHYNSVQSSFLLSTELPVLIK